MEVSRTEVIKREDEGVLSIPRTIWAGSENEERGAGGFPDLYMAVRS